MKRIRLSKVLKLVSRPEDVQPDKTYKLLGAHWYAKGLYIKDIKKGHEIKAKKLYKVEEGDFVYNRLFAWKGSFGLATKEVAGCYVSNEFPCFQVLNSDPEYILWLFKDEEMWDRCGELSKGSTSISRNRLKVEKLLSLEVPLPDLQKQKALSEHFRAVDLTVQKLKGQLNERSQILTELRQSILQHAVQGKLVPQDPNDEPASVLLEKIKAEKERLVKEKKIRKEKELPPIKDEEISYEVPEGWEWTKIGNISKLVEYGTSTKASSNHIGVPVLRMNNIQDGKVIIKDLKYVPANIDDLPRLFLKKNDILFNRTNSYELVGKSGLYKGESDRFTFASYLIRVALPLELVIPEYINYYLNSSVCRISQIEPNITQQNGQANFNGTKLKNILIPLPPLNEQKRIVAKVDQLMSLCDRLEEQLEQSSKAVEQLLQSVLKQTFSSE